ncbi:MAG: protein kinase [Verrucomicrobiota bacterium]
MAEPEAFDHYEVQKRDDGSLFELGRGAMGITYKAFDKNLRVPVALKVINVGAIQSDLARQRFVREARAAAQLRHPNVASVFHLGVMSDTYFYAMEFIEGETLEDLIRRSGPLDPLLALRITVQVARALAAAEKQHLVHRDIKPSNIMLQSGEDDLSVKVIDFGLAKSCKESDNEDLVTLSMGGFIGTPQFASPEQLEEKDLDVRSDIYSLGVTLWYMLAGKAPFTGSLAQVMSQHLSKPPPFTELPNLPRTVVSLLNRMLEKEAAKRFQTSTELRLETEKTIGILAGTGEGTSTAPAPVPPLFDEDFATIAADTVASPGAVKVSVSAPAGTSATLAPESPRTDNIPGKNSPKKGPAFLLGSIAAVLVIAGCAAFFFMRPHDKKPSPATPSSTPVPLAAATPAPSETPPAENKATHRLADRPTILTEKIEPLPVVTPTPTPELSKNDLLKSQVVVAEGYETAKNWPACIEAYASITKNFPESDLGRIRLELLLSTQRAALEKMTAAEFEPLRDPMTTAAQLGVVSAELILAGHLRRTEPKAAFDWFCDAAARGSVPAVTQVGLMYSNGSGVVLDMAKATSWFQRAADQGDPAAKTCLAECFLAGRGTARDEAKAVSLLQNASAAGDLRAMDHLGTCFQKGTGTTRNFEEAARLFKLASDGGYPDSLGNLGVLYINGQGVVQDPQKSVDLFQQGAKQGSAFCMFLLAKCYESGVGVPSNNLQAASWYSKSADLGNPNAAEWCRKNGVSTAAKSAH